VENKGADQPGADSANGSVSTSGRKKKSPAPAPAPKKNKSAATKKPATKPPTAPVQKPSAARPVEPSDEEIRIRAYFLAERRHRLSLPGDSAHDWIEARRQLIEEGSR
jgi:hypothetical protein